MFCLLLATTNQNKITEYRQLLKNSGFKLITLSRKLNFEVPETGKTYAQNAVIKAKAYGKKSQIATLADDTGLEIKALNGFPGIFSNRFAAGNFPRARQEILTRLKGIPIKQRQARFICALALYLPATGKITSFTGTVNGQIALKENGRYGFGYDPIFIPNGYKLTFGQMPSRQKNRLSHRYQALTKLQPYLKSLLKSLPPRPFSTNL